MSEFFEYMGARFSRAPLSFGVTCIGLGMLVADTLNTWFGLSSLVIGNIGAMIGFAGVVFYQTNCKAEKSAASPQGEDGGKTPVE